MKQLRAVRLVAWLGLTPAALGCAQLAGLTGDYHAGAAGAAGSNGGNGASGDAGASSDAGASGATNDAGASGTNDGSAGASGGSAGSGGGIGGTSGAGGGSVGGGAGVSGGSGAAGGPALGPARIGFSEFHDSAAGGDNASSHLANATFTKPTGTSAGDFILVFFGADHGLSNLSGNDLSNVGWTLLDQHEQYGGDGQATYLIYKFAAANEPDPIVFAGINNVPSGNGVQGLLSVYRGVNAVSPVNAYEVALLASGQKDVTNVSTPTPAITTTAANCLLIAGLSPDSAVDAPEVSDWPLGFVENQVSVTNPAHPYPYGWANIYSAERHLPVAGAVPASMFNWKIINGTEYYGSLSFVLALAPAP